MNALEYALQFPWVEPLGRALIHFLWQGALAGLLAWGVLRAARRRTAALRHALAAGALLICALLPVGTFLRLTHPRPTTAATTLPTPARVLVNAPPPAPAAAVSAKPPGTLTPAPVAASPGLPVSARRRSFDVRHALFGISPRGAVELWLAGVLILGARLAAGWLRVQLWRGGARPPSDPELGNRFLALAARFGIDARRARLLVSSAKSLPGPLAMGVWRPVVLLPARVLEMLPLAQIEALLAHELAHVRRHDYLWNLLASALEVILFYHPAVWFLTRELRAAGEECCDTLAADAGVNRVVYAQALAAVAEWRVQAPVPAPAAARGELLARLRRVLGFDAPPEPFFTRRNAGWALALAGLALAAAGILHSGKLMAQTDEDNNDPNVPVLTRPAPRGSVVDADGHPVPGARVLLYHAANFWGLGNGVAEEVAADAEGHFVLTKTLNFKNPAAYRNTPEYMLFARAPGKAPAWAEAGADRPVILTVTTPKPQTFEVVDRAGHPVEGATVWLRYAGAQTKRRPFFAENFSFMEDPGVCRALTGADGRATLTDLPDTQTLSVAASKAGFEDDMNCTTPREGVPRFTLRPAAVLAGRVTDPLGQPVAGAVVSVYPKFRFHQYFLARTDPDGRYRVDKIWSDRAAHPDQPDWGTYTVTLRHPRLAAAPREVAFDAGQTVGDFDFAAVPGTELVGRVFDPATQAPLVGATVAVDAPDARSRQAFVAGADGTFHGRVIPGKISVFFLTPPRGMYVDGDRSFGQLSVSGERFTFDVPAPGTVGRLGVVRGRVRTADGKPAANCEMTALMSTGRLQMGNWSGNQLRGVSTDAHGDFTLPEVPIGLSFTLFAKARDGGATGRLTGKLATDALDLPDPLVLQTSGTGGELLLTDRHGNPRAGLDVRVGTLPEGQRYPVQSERLQSDAQGVVRVPFLAPGARYAVTVVGTDGVTRVANAFDVPPAAAPAPPPPRRTLIIDAQGTLRLLGPDGQPMPIKRIVSYEAATVLEGKRTRWTNDLPVAGREGADAVIPWDKLVGRNGDTSFFLVETDDGSYVRAEGTMPVGGSNLFVIHATEVNPPAPPADPDLGNVGERELAGRVVTPEGQPITGAAIKMPGVHFQEEKVPPVLSGADGVFRMPMPPYRFAYLTVEKEGWATAFLTDVPTGRGFRVTLDRATRLRGSVGGENVGRVALVLKKNKFTRNDDSLDHERTDLALRVRTDEHGAYDFPVEPGRWRWEASSADGRFARGEVNVEPGQTTDLAASLARGADVTFALVDCETGQPVPGIEVYVAEERADRVYSNRAGSNRVSDAGGLLRWENLPPGKLEFESPLMQNSQPGSGRAQYPYTRWWRADEPVDWRRVDYAKERPTGDAGIGWLHVDVQPGMPTVRVLLERGVKISGRVQRADGRGVRYANVQAIGQPGGEVQNFHAGTDQDGNFSAYIPAGNGVTYHLSVYTWPEGDPDAAANAVSESFASKAGDERVFHLTMTKGGWFTGRLVTADGQPAAGFKVSATNEDEMDSTYAARVATAGADGRYRLGPLRAGKYAVFPGTGEGVPVRKLADAPERKGEAIEDGQTRDLGDLKLPAGAKRRE